MASQARREGEDIIAKSHRIIAERNAAKEAAFAETLVTPSKNVNNADVLKNEIIPVDGETGGSSSKRVQSPQITQEISDDSSSSDFSSFNDDDYDDSSGDDNSSGENDYSGDNNYSNEDDGGDNNDDNNDNNDLNDRDSLNDLFPMARDANVITKQVQKFLKAAYRRDSRSWTQEMTKRFREVAPTLNYEICSTTGGKISAHYICKRAKGERAKLDGNIWVHFWFLRVMFGPIACSRQPWFAELAAERPWVLDEADEGVVPKDTAFILWSKTTTWTPKILQKETPTLKKRESEKRKAAEPMKPSRPTKGTKVSRSHNNQDPREISRPRTRTRASINRQNYRNASHSTYEISQSSNEVSQSRDEQNPQNIEAMAPSSNDQQEFNLPSELEIKLLKQKYGAMRSTCDTLEHRIAQLERENERLREESNSFKLEHAWKVDHLWKRMNQLEQNLPGKE
ncbi:hypothetical protein THAR02_08786 [Trichoderma harzianum]|uniref:Uncharacterized protein n=1 Tax=Trichoderma harzianum TaxID=5544 RepID=A0A0G0A1C8_TRIHA|nr:hypothetical protein THAR02_08786 [Trichoderma harzianum]